MFLSIRSLSLSFTQIELELIGVDLNDDLRRDFAAAQNEFAFMIFEDVLGIGPGGKRHQLGPIGPMTSDPIT